MAEQFQEDKSNKGNNKDSNYGNATSQLDLSKILLNEIDWINFLMSMTESYGLNSPDMFYLPPIIVVKDQATARILRKKFVDFSQLRTLQLHKNFDLIVKADYKEHGGKRATCSSEGAAAQLLRNGNTTASTPNIGPSASTSAVASCSSDVGAVRNWTSSVNLSDAVGIADNGHGAGGSGGPASWISTPDLSHLEGDTQAAASHVPTVNLTLPLKKRKVIMVDSSPPQPTVVKKPGGGTYNYRKSASYDFDSSDINAKFELPRRLQIKEVKSIEEPTTNDVQFLIQVKTKTSQKDFKNRKDNLMEVVDNTDSISTASTDDTLVGSNRTDYFATITKDKEILKKDLQAAQAKIERLEKEKSGILLRRLTAMDTSKGNSSEVLKLQQRCNELQTQMENYRDTKKELSLRVKELEKDLDNRPAPQSTQKLEDELRSKLLAAELLCEELMDENEDVKKDLRDLAEEMDEMQDNFREDQADEYSTLKKELEQTTKNCRILSFKLRKTERKVEQVETEKGQVETKLKDVAGIQNASQFGEKIKQLEKDLVTSMELSKNLQKKLEESGGVKKAPLLGALDKTQHNKISRESLTRGGSQDDPSQVARDLQDSLEREADLREQLKFAEEEGQTLRKKAARIEEDNESLVLQLKKMATRTTRIGVGRKSSPTPGALNSIDEKMSNHSRSDLSNVNELKLQLELSEQETAVLRKKLDDLEMENENMKKKNKELLTRPNKTTVGKQDNELKDKLEQLQNDLKEAQQKVTERDRDVSRLESEISLNRRRSSDAPIHKSQEMDQRTLNWKQQVESIEKETEVLRTKVQSLETENEKLTTENKRLQMVRGAKTSRNFEQTIDVNNKLIDQVATLEIELAEANEKVTTLESKTKNIKTVDADFEILNAIKMIKIRKPRIPTELSTKLQLKNMVLDLEREFSDLVKKYEKAENGQKLKETRPNGEISDKTILEIKTELEQTKKKYDELTIDFHELENDKKKSLTNFEKLQENMKINEGELKSSRDEIKRLKEISNDLEIQKNLVETKEKEIQSLSKDLENKDRSIKEVSTTAVSVSSLRSQLTESTHKLKDLDKIRKELEKELKEEKTSFKTKDREISVLKGNCDEFGNRISELNGNIKKHLLEISAKSAAIKTLEESIETERKKKSGASAESATLRLEITELKAKLGEVENNHSTVEKNKTALEVQVKKLETDIKMEKDKNDKLLAAKETDIQNEKKKAQLLKTNHERETKNKEIELAALRSKIKTMDSGNATSQKLSDVKAGYEEKIKIFEDDIKKKLIAYENLTAKYEVLEEEHVVTKAQMISEKESLNSQLLLTKKSLDELEEHAEDYTKKEKMYKKQITELKELIDKRESASESTNLERTNLKAILKERQQEIDQTKREYDTVHNQMEYIRKENDDLKKKLDDYNTVSKIQRNISADSSAMENEIKQLRSKVVLLEKNKKSDISECKIRYEGQVSVLNEELRSLHNQVTRFKREKDTFKHMLEGAQKMIGDLKSGKVTSREKQSIPNYDEMEEAKTKIATLEQQVSCMEDELSEARLDSSKLKTELISERSSLEIKTSELQSRINEMEEEKILSSGRTKIVGLRTRMELSWQKEREEQQRLLQETATLARDLRQTLFEVERERDKERLEARRKTDQIKKTLDEEQDEGRRKITELQCDLLELRDAHAKLRTTNEKLRREKERNEREREEMKFLVNGKRRTVQEEDRRLGGIVHQIDQLMQLAPELFGRERSSAPYTPTPPKRTRSKSRESSPGLGIGGSRESLLLRDDRRNQVQMTFQKLVDLAEELKRAQMDGSSGQGSSVRRDQRYGTLQRATSTENDGVVVRAGGSAAYQRNALHRKSLSLEQSKFLQDNIPWVDSSAAGSDLSLDMSQSDIEMAQRRSASRARRDASLDSRLSADSTQSDAATDKGKKKKSLMGKLKKLTKARSIDDQDPGTFAPMHQLTSKNNSANSDINEEAKGSKKDLKGRITDMFKRSGTRSNSVERQIPKHDTSSTQRPLMREMRNTSNSNLQ